MMDLLVAAAALAAGLVLAAAGYLLLLSAAALVARGRSRPRGARRTRFAVVVPAHDEALNIEAVLRGLLEQDYPADLWDLVVVADNCTDDTARLAREAGARVLERADETRRGKGYALDFAFGELLQAEPRYDAFAILDADSLVSKDFLAEMDAAFEGGSEAVQGHYDVLNPTDNWRTALAAAALAAVHLLRPLGRSLLGLSVGLKGNGMAFSRRVVERLGWRAYSLVEDMEYAFRLCQEGIRVDFAPRARVWAQMPTGGREASTQRRRWEGGRSILLRTWLPRLLGRGLRRADPVALDLAVDLLIPPFTSLVLWTLLLAGAGAAILATGVGGGLTLWLAGSALAGEGLYLLCALRLYRAPRSVYLSLLFAPAFVAWKLWLKIAGALRRGEDDWIRTGRSQIEVEEEEQDRDAA